MPTQKINSDLPIQNNGGVIKGEGGFTSLNPIAKSTPEFIDPIITPPIYPFSLDLGNPDNTAYLGQLEYYTTIISGIDLLTQQPEYRTFSRDVFVMNSGERGNNIDAIYYFLGSPQRNQYEDRFLITPTPIYNELSEVVSSLSHINGDFEFILTNLGLSRINLSGVAIASGGMYVHNVAEDFQLGQSSEWFSNEAYTTYDDTYVDFHYNTQTAALIASKTLTKYTINGALSRAIVTHTYGGAQSGVTVYQQYTFSGNDVTLTAMVDNQTSKYISVPSIGGLNFQFNRIPQGIFARGELNDVQTLGPINASVKDYQDIETGYGGNRTQHFVSCAYANDNSYGVSITPDGLHRQSIYLTSWLVGSETAETKRTLEYFRYLPIKPLCRGGLKLNIRVGSTSWEELLSPYKTKMLNEHGTLKYNTTNWKFFSQTIIDDDRDGFGSGNPYSMQTEYRFDKSSNVQDYINAYVNGLYRSGVSAYVYWNLEGRHPREGVYRMEHDIMPPEVEANLSTLLTPTLSGQNIQYGTSTNIRNFNFQKSYNGLNRYTFTGPNQTQEVPMRLHFMDVTITGSGAPRQLSKVLSSDVDAGNFGTARYTISGVFQGNIALQYGVSGVWTDRATTTSPTSNTFSLYNPSEYVNTPWRFAAKSWISGTGYCRIHTHYSSDNTFNFMLNPKQSAYSGVVYLDYQGLDGNWRTYSDYPGIVFTQTNQTLTYNSGHPSDLFIHYVTPSGWTGKIVIEYNPSGTWLPITGSEGIVRQRDVPATAQTALYRQFTTSVSGWRIRSSGTWTGSAFCMFGHWKDEGSNGLKIDIIPTDWRVRTGAFTGVVYTTMYEDNQIDFLTPPTQVTRFNTNVDFDSHYEDYKSRFQNVFHKGMKYFYADTVSRYYDDFLTLRLLREDLGTDWQFIPEYYNDYMSAYGGTFTTALVSRSPIGTRQTKILNSGNQTFGTPYPVFVAPLFTNTLTGTFTSGQVHLQINQGGWTTVKSYSGVVSEEINSSGSYLQNRPWRLLTSSNFIGNVSAVLQDNLGRDSNGSQTETYVVGYNENDLVSTYTISSSGTSSLPTPYMRGSLGNVVVNIAGTWTGTLNIEKYNNGWQLVKSYSGNPPSYEEFPITQDENWRYTTGSWTGSASLTLGQWRSKVPGYFTRLNRYIWGSGVESVVKMGTEIPSAMAGSYYHWTFQNGFKPNMVSSYEASGLAIQNMYINTDGTRR